MVITIGHIQATLTKEGNSIRFRTDLESALFVNQSYDEVSTIIPVNYKVIRDHFTEAANGMIGVTDLEEVSLKIAVQFFYMYNMWRGMYKREANSDLSFLADDLKSTKTTDAIWLYFKNKYPQAYKSKCEALLAMTPEKFETFEFGRIQFANK